MAKNILTLYQRLSYYQMSLFI